MRKKIIILALAIISLGVGVGLFFASTFSKISDLDIFDIEENDF